MNLNNLDEQRKKLLVTDGHILVLGGPGSGKTTISLLKAEREIKEDLLKSDQKILFMSFARATVNRVIDHAKFISRTQRQHIEINTYHGFIWNLLCSHGHLLTGNKQLQIFLPPEAASHFAEITEEKELSLAKRKVFEDNGKVHFDLFAELATELLTRSQTLLKIISSKYPTIIVDEFQDTNSEEWDFIKLLGTGSRIIALADAEQRIYEFRGASPERIGEFIALYKPEKFDFGTENNRSNGTDIVTFGNDLLSQSNKGKTYKDVKVVKYNPFYGGPGGKHYALKAKIFERCKNLRKVNDHDWSLVALMPSKKLMLSVSNYLLSESDNLAPVSHDIAFDTEGPSLAASLIAGLLEFELEQSIVKLRLLNDLHAHIRGRKGDKITALDLQFSKTLKAFLESGKISGRNKKLALVLGECERILSIRLTMILTGDPALDWLKIRELLLQSESDIISQIGEDAKYLRFFHKGAMLRSSLNEIWKASGSYKGAILAVRNALIQEHFSLSSKDWRGIHLMTIHKSKGKEFDEVIIYDGMYSKLARSNSKQNELAQSLLALRVAVTRAKKRVTLLTPKQDSCQFLI